MATTRGSRLLMVLLAVTVCLSMSAVLGEETFGWDQFIEQEKAKQEADTSVASTGDVTTLASSGGRVTIVVGQKYKTIQAAVNSVPKGSKARVIIYIPNGTYREKLLVERDNIYFKCQSRRTVITYGDTAGKVGGTTKSASTTIKGNGFIASDCTFANSAPPPPGGAVGRQAVALLIAGDMGAFYRCAFYGAQDTLYDKLGRHYFRSCFIQGSIDSIFGNGQSLYVYCQYKSIAVGSSGSITAQNRETNSKTGFVFYQCSFKGTGVIYLGRAWGTYSRVCFIECFFANIIQAIGWQDWNDPSRQKTVFYAEYRCTGPGANRHGRVKWSKVLTAAQAKMFTSLKYIDGEKWLLPKM